MSSNIKLGLKEEDLGETICVICGKPISYILTHSGHKKRPPKYHKGRCEFIYYERKLNGQI